MRAEAEEQSIGPTTEPETVCQGPGESSIESELEKLGLRTVTYDEDTSCLNIDYFLKLTNAIHNISSSRQESELNKMLTRRRQAYQQEDWDLYGTIAEEMGTYKQNMHEEVLMDVCATLGISENDYVMAHSEAADERGHELSFALQGQLLELSEEEK
jgi:hypothetical protein